MARSNTKAGRGCFHAFQVNPATLVGSQITPSTSRRSFPSVGAAVRVGAELAHRNGRVLVVTPCRGC